LEAALKSKNEGVREAAVRALVGIGRAGWPAIADLGRLLQDKQREVRIAAAYALGRLAPEASGPGRCPADIVPLLAQALARDRDKDVRYWIIWALRKFGPDGKKALPALRTALRDKDFNVRIEAADVLARLGPDGIGALREILKDPKCQAMPTAIECLGDLGSHARSAIPELEQLLKTKDPLLRLMAVKALLKICPKRGLTTRVSVLIELLGEEKFAFNAIHLLEKVGPEAKPAAGALAKILSEVDSSLLHYSAATTLAKIGPGARAAVPALTAILKDRHNSEQTTAAVALFRITGKADPGVSVLLRTLRDSETGQPDVIAALGEIGSKARKALPLVREMMEEKGGKMRAVSAFGVWRIDRPRVDCGMATDPRQKALRVLIELLTRGNSAERKEAATFLGEIGREARRAVPALITALKDKDLDVRGNAARALGQIGPAALSAVPALTRALKDDEFGHRMKVILALCKIDRRNRSAISALPSLLGADPLGDGKEVLPTLISLGSEAKTTVPALLRALRNDYRGIYLAAAKALRNIDPKTADKAGVL
jgi:HEAT repeat protein